MKKTTKTSDIKMNHFEKTLRILNSTKDMNAHINVNLIENVPEIVIEGTLFGILNAFTNLIPSITEKLIKKGLGAGELRQALEAAFEVGLDKYCWKD
nr:MAG TPA: hypothetical protein [Caudoviricetes sp.]